VALRGSGKRDSLCVAGSGRSYQLHLKNFLKTLFFFDTVADAPNLTREPSELVSE
jgi:hypothetical protein